MTVSPRKISVNAKYPSFSHHVVRCSLTSSSSMGRGPARTRSAPRVAGFRRGRSSEHGPTSPPIAAGATSGGLRSVLAHLPPPAAEIEGRVAPDRISEDKTLIEKPARHDPTALENELG